MSRVHIQAEEGFDWLLSRETLPPDMTGNYSEGELNASYRIRDMGDDHRPQLVELRYEPEAVVQVHAHDEDEIIYILGGEMHIGGRWLGAGTSVSIAGGTFYGFTAGPEGLQFLNFRPRKDVTFYTDKDALKHK